MKLNPRFPTFRAGIVTLAILFAVFGAVVLLSGRDPVHHGLRAIVVARCHGHRLVIHKICHCLAAFAAKRHW
jgi:hypothetical protein